MRAVHLAALAAASIPTPAFAQITSSNKPNVLLTDKGSKNEKINIARNTENAPLRRAWRVSVLSTESYEFRVTYDTEVSTTTSTFNLVELDQGDNNGTAISGQEVVFFIRPQQVLKKIGGFEATGKSGSRKIVVTVYKASSPSDTEFRHSQSFDFPFDLDPPDPPVLSSIIAGENHLEIEWKAPTETDLGSYQVFWNPDIGVGSSCTTTIAISAAAVTASVSGALDPAAFKRSEKNISETSRKFSAGEDLRNDVCAAVAVRAVDDSDNPGDFSEVAIGKPVPVLDFFEYYRELCTQQGSPSSCEDGGFCFIATAAHGSYAHPAVRVLRWFRDGVMKRTPAGTALVWLYYHVSPPLAALVARDGGLAGTVRVALVPITAMAILWLAAPIFGLGALLWIFRRRLRARAAVVASCLAVCLLAPAVASADRPEAERKRQKGIGLGFEFKGGPYLPEMGAEDAPGAGFRAFENIYGSRSNPLYQLSFDLELFRPLGSVGIGGSWGFMQFVGKAVRTADPHNPGVTTDTTVFNIMPMSLVAFYRFEWLRDEASIPFVPYVRAGLAYHLWWITTDNSEIARHPVPGQTEDAKALGGKWGFTAVGGLALTLDFIDPIAARRLYDSVGIAGTSIFGELQMSQIDDFGGKGFDLSDKTWNLGIYLEY